MSPGAADAASARNAGNVSTVPFGTVALIALTIILDGIDSNVLALSIPALSGDWSLPATTFASLAAMATVAMMVGSAVAGAASDRWGRRPTLIVATAIYGIGGMIGGLASGIIFLAVTRVIAGFGLGAALACAVLSVAEHLPASLRPTVVSIVVLGMPLGGILSGVLAALIMEPAGWRGFYLLTGMAPLLLALAYARWLPETPLFLATRVKVAEEAGHRSTRAPWHARAQVLAQLLAPDLRRDTVLVWSGFFASLLGSYMVLGWLPTLFTQSGASAAQASASISYLSSGSLLGAIISPPLLYRFGSRALMIAAGLLALLIALLLAAHFDSGPDSTLIFFALAGMMVGFGSLNSAFYALLPNLYPSQIRGAGIGFGMSAGRLGAVASAYVGTLGLAGGGALFFALAAGAAALALCSFSTIRRHVPSGWKQANDRGRTAGARHA